MKVKIKELVIRQLDKKANYSKIIDQHVTFFNDSRDIWIISSECISHLKINEQKQVVKSFYNYLY